MIDKLWRIFLSAFYGFFTNRLSTSAAAIAFYTMFALGPIMIFSIAVAEPFVGKWMAEKTILEALGTVVAPEHLRTIQRFAAGGPVQGRRRRGDHRCRGAGLYRQPHLRGAR